MMAWEYFYINNVPYANVFPDDTVLNGSYTYWSAGVDYVVPINSLATNFWIKGDNRDVLIVKCMLNIVIYDLGRLIAPHNRPGTLADDYRQSLQELKGMAEGNITPSLPMLQPNQGMKIRFGGQVKAQNSY